MKCCSDEFADDVNSTMYRNVDRIISKFAKLHTGPGDAAVSDKSTDIAFRRLAAIFGLNQVLEMVDLKVTMLCICFNHPSYQTMNRHLSEFDKKEVRDTYYNFIKKEYAANKYNTTQFGIYIQGINVAQTTRLLGSARLETIKTKIRKPADYDLILFDDDDDDYDRNEYDTNVINHKWRGLDEYRLNWYSREAQEYIYAFIVAMTRYLLKDYSYLNCSVILDLKCPNIDNPKPEPVAFKINMNKQEFRDRMDSLTHKFTPVFEDYFIRPDFKKYIDDEHKIPYWCVDVTQNENDRFPDQPKYLGIKKKDIGIDITEKQYKKDFDKCHWFHIMRAKRYFSQKAEIDEKGEKAKRIGISIHKFNQTIKLYLHVNGVVIRFIPQDVVKWIPYLFMYRDNELKWNQIQPYLQSVLKDNQKFAVQQWTTIFPNNSNYNQQQQKKTNIWEQIKSWEQLDQEFMQKRTRLLNCVKVLDVMKDFLEVF